MICIATYTDKTHICTRQKLPGYQSQANVFFFFLFCVCVFQSTAYGLLAYESPRPHHTIESKIIHDRVRWYDMIASIISQWNHTTYWVHHRNTLKTKEMCVCVCANFFWRYSRTLYICLLCCRWFFSVSYSLNHLKCTATPKTKLSERSKYHISKLHCTY